MCSNKLVCVPKTFLAKFEGFCLNFLRSLIAEKLLCVLFCICNRIVGCGIWDKYHNLPSCYKL